MNPSSPLPPPLHPNNPGPNPGPVHGSGPAYTTAQEVSDPADQSAIGGIAGAVEAMLRHPRRVILHLRGHSAGPLLGALVLVTIACSLVYGLVVGSFSGQAQYWAAPVKVAGGLFISALICLPSLYIFVALGGCDARLVEVFGLVLGLLTMMTLLLVGFAPVAWVFSQSTHSEAAMGALHLAFATIAGFFGIRFLRAGLTHLGGRPAALRIWATVFVLVLLQMTTALRPLVGTSDQFLPGEKKFFLKHWYEQLDESPATMQRGGGAPRTP